MTVTLSSTLSTRRANQPPALCVNSLSTRYENQETFGRLMVDPSAATSEEELGTAIKAYYSKPRRLGFDEAGQGHELILERIGNGQEASELFSDSRLGTVTKSAMLPGIATVLDKWYSGSSGEIFQDTSSIYYDVEEFPETGVNPNEQHGPDTQLQDPESQHFENYSDKSSIVSVLDLASPQYPNYDSRDQLACVSALGSDSSAYLTFGSSEGSRSYLKLTVPLEQKRHRLKRVPWNTLQRRIWRARSRPEETRTDSDSQMMKKKSFWGQWKRPWSKFAS